MDNSALAYRVIEVATNARRLVATFRRRWEAEKFAEDKANNRFIWAYEVENGDSKLLAMFQDGKALYIAPPEHNDT